MVKADPMNRGPEEIEILKHQIRILSPVLSTATIDVDINDLFITFLPPVLKNMQAETALLILEKNRDYVINEFFSEKKLPRALKGQKVKGGDDKSLLKGVSLFDRSISKKSPLKESLSALLRESMGEEINSCLIAPLKKNGFLVILNSRRGKFSGPDKNFAHLMANIFAGKILLHDQIKTRMAQEETEKVLSRYFSPNILKKIKEKEILTKHAREEEVTVMFADIRGFTSMSEKMNAQDVVTLLNTYFNKMVNIILQNDGTIDKFIGDAIFLFWGFPIKHKNDTLLAVLTGMAMQEEVKSMKKKKMLPPGFSIGIGIHRGKAVLGNIGSSERIEFTAVGDTVNVTARLTKIAPPGEIIVSGEVYKDIFYDLEVDPFGKRVLDGKSKEVLTYTVRSLKGDFYDIYEKAF
jgi:class 3 adenylate cyclase